MALSDSWLRANNGRDREGVLEKADQDGLSVRISAKGKIKFQIRFRFAGKNQRCDIGTYPLMGLADARREAQRFRAELEQGKDPRIVKVLERSQQDGELNQTLEKLFSDWYQAFAINAKKGHHGILRSFQLHVFPKLGRLPFSELTVHHWLNILEPLAKGTAKVPGKPQIADRILVNSKQFYKWAKKRHLCENNVLADISASQDLQVKDRINTRHLNDDEIRLMLEACEQSRMEPKNAMFVELLLFYGCRPMELREAKRADFDFDSMVWTVPAERHKMGASTGKPLLRPIIPEIVPLLNQLMALSDSEYLVTNRDSDKCLSRSAIIALPVNIIQWVRKNKNIEMEHWSIYALRKTCRSNMSTLCAPHIAEIILGHKLPGDWGTYDHYHYLPEQAEAYTAWWNRIQRIRNPELYQNVVEMKRG